MWFKGKKIKKERGREGKREGEREKKGLAVVTLVSY